MTVPHPWIANLRTKRLKPICLGVLNCIEFLLKHSACVPGEDTMLSDQPYRYLTVDEMKSLGDDSLPIDVTRDERVDSNRECMGKYIKFSFTMDFGSEVLYLFS